MATTLVISAAPVAAAPAPAAAPASIPTTAPVVPSTPAPAAPTATPAAGATSSPASTGPQPPARPNPSDFGNTIDHYEAEVTWRQEMADFQSEHPDVEIPAEVAPNTGETEAVEGETTPSEGGEKPADGETKTGEEPAKAEETPAVDDEPYLVHDEPSLTPQGLNDLIKGDEALKAAIEANPAAKGALFKMAREHAELSQFKGIYPNKEAAEFARDTANRTISLRAQFEMADGPEGMAKAFDSFAQEFAVIGADGKPVLDQSGAPVYGDDLYAFGEHIVGRYADSSMEEVESRLTANKYASEAERQRDEDLKIALSIIKDDLHPSDTPAADPDLSSLTPDVRAQVQARLDEAKRIEGENKAKAAGAGKQSRELLRTQGNQEFFKASASRMWPQVDKIIDKLRSAGAVIPDWQINTPLPGSKVSAFKNEVGNRIEAYIKADPYAANHMLQLELQYLANPTPETLQQRVAYFDGILQQRDDSGRSLLNRVVSNIVHKYGSSVQSSAEAGRTAEAPSASREPRQGNPVRPHAMTQDEAWSAASQQLAKEVQGWDNMDQGERMSYIFSRQRQLLTAKR